jgi:hypothetical protein
MDTPFPLQIQQILTDLSCLEEDGAKETFFSTFLTSQNQTETKCTSTSLIQ